MLRWRRTIVRASYDTHGAPQKATIRIVDRNSPLIRMMASKYSVLLQILDKFNESPAACLLDLQCLCHKVVARTAWPSLGLRLKHQRKEGFVEDVNSSRATSRMTARTVRTSVTAKWRPPQTRGPAENVILGGRPWSGTCGSSRICQGLGRIFLE